MSTPVPDDFLDRLAAEADAAEKAKPVESKPPAEPAEPASTGLTDEKIIELLTCRAKNAEKAGPLWRGDASAFGGDESRADFALCRHIAFYCGRDPARIDSLFRRSGLMRDKWEERRGDSTYGANTIANALDGMTEFYKPRTRRPKLVVRTPPAAEPAGATQTSAGPAQDDQLATADGVPGDTPNQPPKPKLTTAERRLHRLGNGTKLEITNNLRQLWEPVEDADAAITRTNNPPRLFRRAGSMVRVEKDDGGLPLIWELNTHGVQHELSLAADWFTIRVSEKSGHIPEADAPAMEVVKAYHARASWPGVPNLAGVSVLPVLRPDGSIHQTPGYDPATGVLYEPVGPPLVVPENPTQEDARAAAGILLAGVRQFRWRDQSDASAWLSSAVTLAVRHAIRGPVPLFVMRATGHKKGQSGTGKTILAKAAVIIGTGREAPSRLYPTKQFRGPPTEDDEELAKLATSVAIGGHAAYLLDNIPNGHRFGSAGLDAIITCETDAGRQLMTNDASARAATCVWFGTGNNVCPKDDSIQRVVNADLDVTEASLAGHDYDGPELTAWARDNQPVLFTACLTIVSAYMRAGHPDVHLSPYNRFPAWSRLVRSALVWAGLPDPCLPRLRFAVTSEDEQRANTLMILLDSLSPNREPLLVAEMLQRLRADLDAASPRYPGAGAAIKALFPTGLPSDDETAKHRLGMMLKKGRGVEFEGRKIDATPAHNKTMLWFVQGEQQKPTEKEQQKPTEKGQEKPTEKGQPPIRTPQPPSEPSFRIVG